MKKIISIILSAIGLLAAQMAQAQGTVFVSNLGATPVGSAAIGSDSWVAQQFITGTNSGGYVLNSVQLLMNTASGNPGGFSVSIYSFAVNAPASNLGSLTGLDPSAGGIFTYTASGLTLSPNLAYFVVLTSTTTMAQGGYVWSAATGVANHGIDRWLIFGQYYNSADGLSWQGFRNKVFQLALFATPVPEPATYALAGLGLAISSFLRRRPGKSFF